MADTPTLLLRRLVAQWLWGNQPERAIRHAKVQGKAGERKRLVLEAKERKILPAQVNQNNDPPNRLKKLLTECSTCCILTQNKHAELYHTEGLDAVFAKRCHVPIHALHGISPKHKPEASEMVLQNVWWVLSFPQAPLSTCCNFLWSFFLPRMNFLMPRSQFVTYWIILFGGMGFQAVHSFLGCVVRKTKSVFWEKRAGKTLLKTFRGKKKKKFCFSKSLFECLFHIFVVECFRREWKMDNSSF